ncbi:MAG: SpoIIE family protein phosphatase [Planctomycetes bacterium]|nr:SpoIIE family protein phosphatase [Planctomycetota bacterium]
MKSKPRILVVDDETDVRTTIARMLEGSYHVATAASGEEALRIAQAQPQPDLAIVDLVLPGIDGFSLLSWFREHSPGTEVIVITGDTYDADAKLARALSSEAFYFLTKPFDRVALEALVDRCLVIRSLRRNLLERNRTLERDLAMAREFQTGLLPKEPLEHEGVTLRSWFAPCDQLAGDHFDYRARGRTVYFWVADVVGHGVQAAMSTGIIASAWSRAVRDDPELVAIHRALHDVVQDWEDDRWFSALLGRFDLEASQLEYINAGHPSGLVRTASGRILELDRTAAMISPAFPYLEPEVGTLNLRRGARALFLTDGILEMRNVDGELFTEERVRTILESDPDDVLRYLEEAVRAHQGLRPTEDDLTALLLERT